MAFDLSFEWFPRPEDPGPVEVARTMGFFQLQVNGENLAQNLNIWSEKTEESVLLSAYPLAAWIASSWWRLLYEPLPPQGIMPTVNWRMSHELAAANEGFIWPKVVMATDGDCMRVWSAPSSDSAQSIRYIKSLSFPEEIDGAVFERELEGFVSLVLARLEAENIAASDLAGLWDELSEERGDFSSAAYRRLEAQLGYDPDECPEDVIEVALSFSDSMGEPVFSEIAPAYGGNVAKVKDLLESSGLAGKPNLGWYSPPDRDGRAYPWQRAKEMAYSLRQALDLGNSPITTEKLCELVEVKISDLEGWIPPEKQRISLAAPDGDGLSFHLRKRHPDGKRFEIARLIGDCIEYGGNGSYLVSTDFRKSRQKFQRAFASEFLSPLSGLLDFMNSDFSESTVEDAADYYKVSTKVVELSLANGSIDLHRKLAWDPVLPY
ncbi:M78 family metallopeptidase domain-containing protein [Dethiosulfovibrio salsuginis]|uniref:Uncharacterized protein n=1 Tax=Dethiosulfovibrio salsuginis TaxID=561720 RepID=A0A1X7IVA4_9BACT|nr:hypothetical protein [Dethiosulfovibrio salsuginis]SMG18476.1 hypothetical protein SAMN06275492_10533 [Dethiosulfovibrio salsuginis]